MTDQRGKMLPGGLVMDLFGGSIVEQARELFAGLGSQPEETRIDTINELRKILHEYSPFAAEPVDCVLWVKSETVQANDYNPNSVAPPEMRLLEHSILEDGYTQPIVAWENSGGARGSMLGTVLEAHV